jgi:hypothetical protein
MKAMILTLSPRRALAGVFLGSLALAACRTPGDSSWSAAAAGENRKNAAADDPKLEPARRPDGSQEALTIPQLLAKTRADLDAERERAKRAEEALVRAQTDNVELRAQAARSGKEMESARGEREKLQTKVRELQEKLVTAALRIASSEKETLESKIAFEKALADAADAGVILDPAKPKDGSGAASRPAPKNPNDSATQGSERR